MKLSVLLTPERVILDVREKDKNALLGTLIQRLASLAGVSDPAGLEKEVKEREELGNTGIGRGIGFPHAKSALVSDIQVVLARPAKPVDYGSLDGQPVTIVLLIVAPADGDNNVYLHTMARISRLLGKSDVRQQILAAKSAEDVCRIVEANEA